MRGAPVLDVGPDVHGGIIPAYAGSTWLPWQLAGCSRDHPRVCGEHARHSRSSAAWMGSSPRMRGAPQRALPGLPQAGIIPAYAGSTEAWRRARREVEDHPRVCGEHFIVITAPTSCVGSSPRMRGALLARAVRPQHDGIIPAYAGSTWIPLQMELAIWDHPRVCGEHYYDMSEDEAREGSSPRMRGAQRRCNSLL